MTKKRISFAASLRLLGHFPFPNTPPTKAELDYWDRLFEMALPGRAPDECLMDRKYIAAYIEWLEKAAEETLSQEKAILAVIYQTWLKYLDHKEERHRLYYVGWGTTWNEGYARREPLHELHQKADLAGRRLQCEFDFPDEPKTGEDPALDTLRARYRYYSYSRAEVREAVEKEFSQLKTNLAELRGLGGDKFNREILPGLTRAIDNFLSVKPLLGSPGENTGQPGKEVKESTRLLSLVVFVDNARGIIDAVTTLKKILDDETPRLAELTWRLNALTRAASGGDWPGFDEETDADHWQRDYARFEQSKNQAFDLAKLAWENLAAYAGVDLAFHPAYTGVKSFFEVIHYQQKTTDNLRVVAFCWAWHTYLKTADRTTFNKLLTSPGE